MSFIWLLGWNSLYLPYQYNIMILQPKNPLAMEVEKIMQELMRKHSGEPEYLQAVKEVLTSIQDVYNQHPEFEKAKLIERLVEPERVIQFRRAMG